MQYTPFSALFKVWAYIKRFPELTSCFLFFVISMILTQTGLKGTIFQISCFILTPGRWCHLPFSLSTSHWQRKEEHGLEVPLPRVCLPLKPGIVIPLNSKQNHTSLSGVRRIKQSLKGSGRLWNCPNQRCVSSPQEARLVRSSQLCGWVSRWQSFLLFAKLQRDIGDVPTRGL
jgi:hypothetical protein